MSDKNIYQRINDIKKTINYVKKDADVGFGSSKYKAVSHDQVTGLTRNPMVLHGVHCYAERAETPANMVEAGKTQKGAIVWRYEAEFLVHFINVDDPGDRFSQRVDAHANDHGDKAPGKALSYAIKMAKLKVFDLETGENDEARYQDEDLVLHNKIETQIDQAWPDDLKAWFKEKPRRQAKAIRTRLLSIGVGSTHCARWQTQKTRTSAPPFSMSRARWMKTQQRIGQSGS